MPPTYNRAADAIPVKGYHLADFRYHPTKDTYTCPEQHTLTTNGHWYSKVYNRSEKTKTTSLFKQYKTEACRQCPAKQLCTVLKGGRVIERSQYAEALEANHKRIQRRPDIYRRRQQIIEHPSQTIKRWWGYSYTLLKGLEKVSADLGLVYLCYNLKRVMNILTVKTMMKKLQMVGL